MKILNGFLVFLVVTFSGIYGWCGYEMGNGGHAISCASQTKLLDLFEGANLYIAFPEVMDPFARANAIFDAWSGIDPTRIEKWKADLVDLKKHTTWTKKGEYLILVADEGPTVLPVGCTIRQAAVQARDPITDIYGYNFDSEIWAQFDNDSRTALLVHEILYKDLLSVLPSAQSYLIRSFVRFILSANRVDVSLGQYLRILKNIGYPFYVADGWYVDLRKSYITNKDALTKATVFYKWGDECGWSWSDNQDMGIVQLFSNCDDTPPAVSLQLNRYELKFNASYIELSEGKISYLNSNEHGNFKIFSDHNVILGLYSPMVKSYSAVIGPSDIKVDITPSTSDRGCGDVMMGPWGFFATCANKSSQMSHDNLELIFRY
ncbi:MAG TPA: hypothetical protein VF412_17330 [Bdellovibrio sp.]|uniref:hypothetical protein n=1 Tax=Bdellovibrio sp. TaxID=28201 RepID=UPI002EE70460